MLTPSASIAVAGTIVSLAPGATALIVNGLTSTLAAQAQAVVTSPPLLTVVSRTYTAASGDGANIVLSPQATELIYGSLGRSTSTALFPATTTDTGAPSASEGQDGGG